MDHFLLAPKTTEVGITLHFLHFPSLDDLKPQLALSQATCMKGSSKHPYQVNRFTSRLVAHNHCHRLEFST
jgi:hypothetical protein